MIRRTPRSTTGRPLFPQTTLFRSPTSAATPISILTREILQYSSNIEQAYNIAKRYRTFVSESILIGSASDSIAAIIEKTPNTTQLYTNSSKEIICTNHFQSSYFKEDKHNLDNIANSDSKYRWERLNQLLDLNEPIDYTKAITILRDQKGINGEDIGLANEKSPNQSIAHHSVLFDIYKLRMWVTTSKWLGGEYICYDLKDIFNKMDNNNLESSFQLLNKPELIINRDSSYIINDYPRVISFRNYVKDINRSIKYNETLNQSYIDNFISINPGHYLTWKIIGDYFKSINEIENSKKFYSHALECEIPYKSTELEIEKLINSK